MGSDFRGCGATEGPDVPEDGAELPSITGCVVDEDCVPDDMCVQVACRGGACVEVDRPTDADGDGFEPAPCGEDCNDSDPDRFPGATERCDRVDQDCDGEIDEGAIGAAIDVISDALEHAIMVGTPGGFVVVGEAIDPETAAVAVFAHRVDEEGEASGRARIADGLGRPRAVVGGPEVAVAGVEEDGRLVVATFDAAGASLTEVGERVAIEAVDEVLRVGAARFADQLWVAYDVVGGRRLWRSGDGSTIELEPDPAEGVPDLATDGISLFVTEGARTLHAFAADGTSVGEVALLGAFASQPIADGDGDVVAVYRDAFDHAMVRVTLSSTTPPVMAPLGERADDVAPFRAGDRVVLTRSGPVGVRAWVLEENLSRYAANLGSISVRTETPETIRVVTLPSGLTAAHVSRSEQSSVIRLVCEGT